MHTYMYAYTHTYISIVGWKSYGCRTRQAIDPGLAGLLGVGWALTKFEFELEFTLPTAKRWALAHSAYVN
jgi:hypothetical protein